MPYEDAENYKFNPFDAADLAARLADGVHQPRPQGSQLRLIDSVHQARFGQTLQRNDHPLPARTLDREHPGQDPTNCTQPAVDVVLVSSEADIDEAVASEPMLAVIDLITGLLGGGTEGGGLGGIITDGISAGIADAISELFTGSAEGLSSVAE